MKRSLYCKPKYITKGAVTSIYNGKGSKIIHTLKPNPPSLRFDNSDYILYLPQYKMNIYKKHIQFPMYQGTSVMLIAYSHRFFGGGDLLISGNMTRVDWTLVCTPQLDTMIFIYIVLCSPTSQSTNGLFFSL